MNTQAQAPRQTMLTIEQFREQILPPQRKIDLYKALPAHIKAEVFERNLTNALMQNPRLISLPPPLIFREVSKAAALGLLLDPQLGEAYIVTVWNGKVQRQEPQLRVGYRGLLKLARQAGGVEAIYAHEVCANDEIRCELGTNKELHHRPNVFGDRGPVVGYYAVIKTKEGTDFEPMSRAQVLAIRDRSEGWKAYQAERVKTTPWLTDEDEMSKKTVLRRLMKRIPQSPELQQAINIEDNADFPHFRTPAVIDEPPPPSQARIEQKTAVPFGIASRETDAEYVDMVESGRELPGDVVWEDDPPPPSSPKAPDPPGNVATLKQALMDEIRRMDMADLDRCVNDEDFYKQKGRLAKPDQDAVDLAWMQRKNELRSARQ